MTLRRIWALALSMQSALAFKDTSPLFLFSTSRLTTTIANPHLASSSHVGAELSKALASCPSDTYILISQPGVVAADFATGSSSPNLRSYLNKTGAVKETWVVPEVAGVLDAGVIEKQVVETCNADVLRIDATTGTIPNDGVYPRTVFVRFPTLPNTHGPLRAAKLEEHDSFLHAVVSQLGGSSYTVIYTSSPPTSSSSPSSQDYEMDSPLQSILHTDMKRDINNPHTAKSNTSDLALFDRYEFLSPGVFMGLFISLILFMILYVGISAVASVEVSYFAFSKEMGPSGQKKQ